MSEKIIITGDIEVKTGLHIGGGENPSSIGAANVVIKDPVTKLPIIPGSSLKGKIRSLLAKERGSKDHSQDGEDIFKLFGGSPKSSRYYESRLQFFDCFLTNHEKLGNPTEIKYENKINREKSTASLRSNERVIKGAVFGFKLVYNIPCQEDNIQDEIIKNFNILAEGLKLLQLDYLGGSGTRGYGRIAFDKLSAKSVGKDKDDQLLTKLNDILKDCNNYARLFD
ncbi:MAG: type III-A CRISPR-associated RAMP protein Csm3 [Clostridiales bacterium]|nr:type III-A CRISPR-associated RAMP protein Csm3 [Clostridiales bacterium]